MEDADDGKYRKIGSVKRLFEGLKRDYYKPKVVNRGFASEVNIHIKYMSEGAEDEKLSPEEYLNMNRLDLINIHKPIEGFNNNDNNNNNTDNNTNTTNNNNTRTMHPKSK